MGSRMREDTGRGDNHGAGFVREQRRWVAAPVGVGEGRGMGPRIREDKGGEVIMG